METLRARSQYSIDWRRGAAGGPRLTSWGDMLCGGKAAENASYYRRSQIKYLTSPQKIEQTERSGRVTVKARLQTGTPRTEPGGEKHLPLPAV